MTYDIQSIEDLINSSNDRPVEEESTAGKFRKKQTELKTKDVERQTEEQAQQIGVPYINLFGFAVSPEALKLISEEDAEKNTVACFYYDGTALKLASPHPAKEMVTTKLKELTKKYHCPGEIFMISKHSWDYILDLYKSLPKVRKFSRDVELKEKDLIKFSEKFSSFNDLQEQINKAEISDIVTMILASALKAGASDIHIEAEQQVLKVRFRVDGVLHDVAKLSMELWKKIISRLKLLSRVKINIVDRPQDGRFSIVTKSDKVDIRVSFLPTNYGESVVMRLLKSSVASLRFSDLGLVGRAAEQLKREITRPNGMIISTGPTGSGKTTSQYAILKSLNKPQTKIITIEDPIEYQLEGINQTQTTKEYSFAKGLRSIVRQDPDIILVGEIRDLETAEIAIQAALTGHLVLSTIHTNDAAGTIPRFLAMGTKPFFLAPALNVMIGQRLVRRVCDKCKEEIKISDDLFKRIVDIMEKIPAEYRGDLKWEHNKFHQGKGCKECQGIGFKGRIGIFEIMTMNKKVEQMILGGKVSEYEMREMAISNGMITMVQDGLIKAFDGVTTPEEVFRITDEK